MRATPGPLPPPSSLALEGDEGEWERLKEKIHRERGFNCLFYKDKCLRRRIAVRLRARAEPSFEAYASLLDRDPAEYDLLLDTLTINVTKFFRNLPTWEAVEEHCLPTLFAGSGVRRIWSAGSASGEEAYTVSILLRRWAEHHGGAGQLGRFRIVGTDIDRRSLEAARQAEYPELSLVETPAEVRERWFGAGPPFRLVPEARENVSFLRRDLISEPPLAEQSLIFCRNVVIYFDRGIQESLFQTFYDALVPGGFLVMGKVETLVGPARARFRSVHGRERIFQKPL
ncbi:MAG: protein-glutamate O-methyltransferase CheR [Gemmatimonadota bacterium]|nr:protein-glutamate O-methyltransferase CheR [Gemmatimonadota bacterium]